MQNHTIEIEALPDIKALTKQTLARHYKIVNLFTALTVFFFLTLSAYAARRLIFQNSGGEFAQILIYLPIVLIIFGLLLCCYQWFADQAKYFSIREHDISFFNGLLFRRLVTQPISRIQHVEVSQGPIDRFAGLGKLQVYSAGSSMQTFAIPGLPIEVAHQLRQQLTQSAMDNKDTNQQHD